MREIVAPREIDQPADALGRRDVEQRQALLRIADARVRVLEHGEEEPDYRVVSNRLMSLHRFMDDLCLGLGQIGGPFDVSSVHGFNWFTQQDRVSIRVRDQEGPFTDVGHIKLAQNRYGLHSKRLGNFR